MTKTVRKQDPDGRMSSLSTVSSYHSCLSTSVAFAVAPGLLSPDFAALSALAAFAVLTSQSFWLLPSTDSDPRACSVLFQRDPLTMRILRRSPLTSGPMQRTEP